MDGYGRSSALPPAYNQHLVENSMLNPMVLSLHAETDVKECANAEEYYIIFFSSLHLFESSRLAVLASTL